MLADPGQVDHRAPGSSAVDSRKALESALRVAVAECLGEPRFSLWFGDGVHLGVSGDGNVLEIQVPSDFFREWIQGHFSGSLLEAAQTVIGRQVHLNFTVRAEVDPAPGDIVKPVVHPGWQRTGSSGTVPLPGNSKTPLSSPIPPPGERIDSPAPRFLPPPANRVHIGRTELREQGSTSQSSSSEASFSIRSTRRLDDFVTGSSNRLAYAAAEEMIHTAGASFNPLVIHGGVGLGKTHLLEAIAQGLRQAHPSLNVLCITAEAFTNSFLDAMRSGTLSSFRSRHRRLGALAMDGIHFLAGTRATQNEFLHTFNALIERGTPIVVTADQHPRRISRLTEELVTRFLGGMVVKLEAPDLPTRRAILQAKSEARGVSIPVAVLDYIAQHLRSSVRELEGALHSVIAHTLLTGKRLDLMLAKVALREMIRHSTQTVGLREIEHAVCQLFQIDAEALKSDSRARALAYPRMVAMYLARKHTEAAYSEIGRHFGGRNHSTVISAERKVQGWLRDEEQHALLPGFETIVDLMADLERTLGA